MQFIKLPITPNSLIDHKGNTDNAEPIGGFKKILSFDEVKSILMIGDQPVRIRNNSDQYHLLRIIFAEPDELSKDWFYSEIAEKFDLIAKLKDKKFYNALYQIQQKVARDAQLSDVFISNTQSIKINPKYLKP